MSFKRVIFLLLAVQVIMPVRAQTSCNNIFTGKIVDETNRPVLGAAILLVGEQAGQATDELGVFRFENLCDGRYKVKVQSLGFKEQEFEVTVRGEVKRTIRLEEEVTQLSEIVIEHHDDTHTEHVNNFVQLNEKQLTALAGKSLGQALKELSGVNSVQTGPGIFKPVIHGVHSQRVLILNHGIRHEGQQWGAEHAPEIDPFIASNIVVVKDASAIKYGPDALGGVIIVNPPALPADAGLGGTISTVLQSNGRSGTLSGMLEGGIRHHHGWGWRIQGTVKRTGDFKAPGYNLPNTGIREVNFSAATGLHTDNAGFDIFFSHFETEIGILRGTSTENVEDLVNAMEASMPQYTRSFSYAIREPRQEASHNLLKLNGHITTDRGEWRLQYGFQNDNRREFDIRIGDLSKIPAIDLQLNTHTLEAEWETAHSQRRTLSFGVNNMYQDNNNIFGTRRIPFIPNFNSLSSGVFGVAKFNFNAWSVNVGGRYDYRYYRVSGRDSNNRLYRASYNFSNVSATAGATAQLSNKQTLSLNLSAAWRPPHVSELYSFGKHLSAGANEYGLLLNPQTSEVMNMEDAAVKAEQALKFVSTYRKEHKRFEVEVSAYANYIFNYIFLRPERLTITTRGPAPALRYAQTDALFLGADLTGTWHVHKFIKVLPKVSVINARDERNDGYLVYIPSNRAELALRYERPTLSMLKNFYVESRGTYIARQDRSPRVVSGRDLLNGVDPFEADNSTFDFLGSPSAYALWNLSAGFEVKAKNVRYDFRIASENTLNTSYREYTNRFRYYADDLGRNFIFSVKCVF